MKNEKTTTTKKLMLKKLGHVLTTALSYLFSLYIQTLPDILQIILLTVWPHLIIQLFIKKIDAEKIRACTDNSFVISFQLIHSDFTWHFTNNSSDCVTTFDYSITIQCVATKEKLPKRCLLFPTYLVNSYLSWLKPTLPWNFALIFMLIINR